MVLLGAQGGQTNNIYILTEEVPVFMAKGFLNCVLQVNLSELSTGEVNILLILVGNLC